MKRFFPILIFGLLPSLVSGQAVFVSQDFEAVGIGAIPAGWQINDGSGGSSTSNMQVIANPSASGINTSAQVLAMTSGSNKDLTVGALNITSRVAAGDTFTISFDLLAPTTTDPGFIFGFGDPNASGASQWEYTPANQGFGLHHYTYLTANTWQHYSFDVTADINSVVPGLLAPNNFSVNLQAVAAPGDVYLDNFQFVAIPEPSQVAAGFALFALGLVGAREVRRRRACAS